MTFIPSPLTRGLILSSLILATALPAAAQNRDVSMEWLRNAGSRWTGPGGSVEYAGRAVSGAGDVNGDGIDDFLVAAFDTGFLDDPGRVYLIYGVPFGLPFSSSLAAADVVLVGGQDGDSTGMSLAPAGDVDGDTYDDILIGAPASDGSFSDTGHVFLVYGGPSLPATINLMSAPSGTLTRFEGPSFGASLGEAVAGLGDVNGDLIPDLGMGAPGESPNGSNSGRSYIVYGSNSFGDTINLSALGSGEVVRIDGIATSDVSGATMAPAGDFDGDGFRDLLIGARTANPNAKNDAGQSYVVYGDSSLPDSISLSSLGAAGVKINGHISGNLAGASVSGGGDVNDDGFDDVMVGAPEWDIGPGSTTDEGRAYVIYGGSAIASVIELGTLGAGGVTFTGNNPDDSAGSSVAVGGDMNRDGYADVLVGARNVDTNGTNAGAGYLVHGSPALPSSVSLGSLGSLGVEWDGNGTNSRAGHFLSFLGDVNGSGFDNYAVSERFANGNAGRVSVIDGSCGVLAAEGTLFEGDTFTMKIHGTPGAQYFLFFGAFVLSTPVELARGPFWMAPPFKGLNIRTFDVNGEDSYPVTIPTGLSLSGLTAYWQKFEEPNGGCILGQVLHTTVQ